MTIRIFLFKMIVSQYFSENFLNKHGLRWITLLYMDRKMNFLRFSAILNSISDLIIQDGPMFPNIISEKFGNEQ